MQKIKNKNKILLTGGGTGGSVAPLLAIQEELSGNNIDFLFIGTKSGVEKVMITETGVNFKSIFSGKLRRYFSFKNFTDLFLIFLGFLESLWIVLRWRPDLIITAGSFVSVPVVWAGWLLGVRVMVHQQDIRPGLANKLMAPFADIITVVFENSLYDYGKKAIWIGNPVRRNIMEAQGRTEEAQKIFKLNSDLPVILIVGGGTGADGLNHLVFNALKELVDFFQIIHVTGIGKKEKEKNIYDNYKQYEFLTPSNMALALAIADIVVSRSGMGFLSEIAFLKKPAILIPMPDSHQEDNAKIFFEKEAAVVVNQKNINHIGFLEEIKKLAQDENMKNKLKNNINKVMRDRANETIKNIILKEINEKQ